MEYLEKGAMANSKWDNWMFIWDCTVKNKG